MVHKAHTKTIVGVGSALVDILIRESDSFVSRLCDAKGGMTLVDKAFIEQVLAGTTAEPSVVPGGSACNTIIGIGRMGGNCRFVGKLGDDEAAHRFRQGLRASGVEPCLATCEQATGNVLSIITPDAQRTMFTFLGASSEMIPGEMTPGLFADAAIVHVEGYLAYNHDLLLAVVTAASAAGARISLDLASFTVVEASRDYLADIVDKYVDILLANEDEALAFTGCDDETRALEVLAGQSRLAVLKVGARGSLVSHEGQITKIAPLRGAQVVDTTGAGDLWASGFLYGLVREYPIETCGALGSACGYEVCQVIGAVIPDEGWNRIRSHMP